MSEMLEVRRLLASLNNMAIATNNDVKWIKEGMVNGRRRMDRHDKDIAALKNRQTWISGAWAGVGAFLGIGGGHFIRVMVAAVALSALLINPAPGATRAVIDSRRAAIVTTVRSIGVYPGAEITVGGNTYAIDDVQVSPDYVVTIRTRLIRSTD